MVVLSKDVNSQTVPEPTVFNDQSALNVQSNLQSQAYQDFIHQLYRFDKDSLKRVDNLFQNPSQAGKSATNGYANQQQEQSQTELQERLQQPSYSTYIASQSQLNNNRYKRDAHGAIFRPRFVYRIYQDVKQDRLREREEERIQKRLYNSYRKRLSSPNYSKNEY